MEDKSRQDVAKMSALDADKKTLKQVH